MCLQPTQRTTVDSLTTVRPRRPPAALPTATGVVHMWSESADDWPAVLYLLARLAACASPASTGSTDMQALWCMRFASVLTCGVWYCRCAIQYRLKLVNVGTKGGQNKKVSTALSLCSVRFSKLQGMLPLCRVPMLMAHMYPAENGSATTPPRTPRQQLLVCPRHGSFLRWQDRRREALSVRLAPLSCSPPQPDDGSNTPVSVVSSRLLPEIGRFAVCCYNVLVLGVVEYPSSLTTPIRAVQPTAHTRAHPFTCGHPPFLKCYDLLIFFACCRQNWSRQMPRCLRR